MKIVASPSVGYLWRVYFLISLVISGLNGCAGLHSHSFDRYKISPIAKVAVEEAFLYSEPSASTAPKVSVPLGTTLVIDGKSGSWYRVYAPKGERAWISEDVIKLMPRIPGVNRLNEPPQSDVESRLDALEDRMRELNTPRYIPLTEANN
jgi:hypothetical protein